MIKLNVHLYDILLLTSFRLSNLTAFNWLWTHYKASHFHIHRITGNVTYSTVARLYAENNVLVSLCQFNFSWVKQHIVLEGASNYCRFLSLVLCDKIPKSVPYSVTASINNALVQVVKVCYVVIVRPNVDCDIWPPYNFLI